MISRVDTFFPVFKGELDLKPKHVLWIKRLHYDHLTQNPFIEEKKTVLYYDKDPFEGLLLKLLEASREVLAQPVEIKSVWSTIFYKDGFHSLHTHPNTDWILIYYLDASGQKGGKVKFFWEKETLEISPKTGEFLLLPGCMPHEVTPSKLISRTIISFNLNHVS